MVGVSDKPTKEDIVNAIEYMYQLRENYVGKSNIEDYVGKSNSDYVRDRYFRGCMGKFETLAYGLGIATYLESRNLTIAEAKKLFSSSRGADDEAFRTAPYLERSGMACRNDDGVVCDFASVLSYAPKVLIGSASEDLKDHQNPYCALAAAAYVAAIFDGMGITGPNGEDLLDGDYVASAALIHGVTRKKVNGRYIHEVEPCNGGILGNNYRNYDHFNKQDKNLAQLILDGDVKCGDIISIPVNCDPSNGSGFHAMFVSSVEHYIDDRGQKQARYTVVDNNGGDVRTRYRIIDTASNDKYDSVCNNQYVVYTSVNKFVSEYMWNKANNLDGSYDTDISSLVMSLEYLEKAMMLDTSYENNCGGSDRFQKLEEQKEKIIERYMEKYQYKLKNYGELDYDWEDDSWAKDKNDLYTQCESSNRALKSNRYLLENNIYGKSEGHRIDQALARRASTQVSNEQSITTDVNITPSEFIRMNEKDSRA